MARVKKLKYREVPQAIMYVVRMLWSFSPSYVLMVFGQELKDRAVPYVTLFSAASVTSKLPEISTNPDVIWEAAWLLGLAFAAEVGSRLIDLYTRQRYTQKEEEVAVVLREFFYRQYARLPYHLYEDKNVIDAFNYADQFMYRFGQFGILQVARTVGGVIEFLFAIVALATVAWFMPLLLIFLTPFLLRSLFLINRERVKMQQENQAISRQIWTIEYMFYPRAIKETRLYNVVDYLLTKRRKLTMQRVRSELALGLRQNKLGFIQDTELRVASLVASFVALWRIAYQSAPLGIFVLAQQLTQRAGAAVDTLFSELSQFDEDLYGFSEFRYITEELQETESDLYKLRDIESPAIRYEKVDFTYPGSKAKVLKDISLQIPFGESVAIVGENGAGKTTLVKLLLGLYRPNNGVIYINDKPMNEYDTSSWLAKAGVLLQDFGMDQDITIREMIRLGDITKEKSDKEVWAALEEAEIKDAIKELPHKLDTYLGKWIDEEKGTELSGGQLQRLAIARALYRDPDILVLDEPTSAVDANAEERIFERLSTARAGKTTIFISHRFSTLRRAKHIIFVEKGEIVEQGSHEELLKLNGKYKSMFETQAKGYR